MMKHRYAVILLPALIAVGWAIRTPAGVEASTALNAWLAAGPSDCILSCYDTVVGGHPSCEEPGVHLAPQAGDWAEYREGYHNEICYDGSCPQKHPTCGFPEGFQILKDMIVRGAADELTALAQSSPSNVRLVRNAIQLLDCDQHVIGHIPIPASPIGLQAD